MKHALENKLRPDEKSLHCGGLFVCQPCVNGEPTLIVYIPYRGVTEHPVTNIHIGPFTEPHNGEGPNDAPPMDAFICSMAKEPESLEEAATMIREAQSGARLAYLG